MSGTVSEHTELPCYAESMGIREEDGAKTATLVFPAGNAPALTLSDVWEHTPLILTRADSHADLIAALEAARVFVAEELDNRRSSFEDDTEAYTADAISALAKIDAALDKARAS